jgi:hypothetical protein
MNREDMCFKKAVKMIELGLVQLSEEMDIFQLTDLLIKLEEEKEYKNQKTDNLIDYNDEIMSVKEVGVLETIDISVSGDNLFYCNNILTKNSFGLPATADFMFALISTEELEQLNQIMVKQLKNRYGDPNHFKRFVIGIDRAKMRLYDAEQTAQMDIIDSGQDTPPLNTFGNRQSKFNKNFGGIKV